jgi:phosphoribosylamine--glycine ligase
MRILLIGSGGREHALAWKLALSPLCERLFIAPGNPGTAQCGTNRALDVADHAAVAAAAPSRTDRS